MMLPSLVLILKLTNMFTGIITTKGVVRTVAPGAHTTRITFSKPASWRVQNGESIAIDGVCSTVVGKSATQFSVEYMKETLRKTTVRNWRVGSIRNLERPMKYGDRVHGHFILGHVDNVAKVKSVGKSAREFLLTFTTPKNIHRYIVPHGSIALNGVALTLARVTKTTFTVALVPYTLKVTNIAMLRKGDIVNVEVDYLARYHLTKTKRATVAPHAKKTVRKSRSR